LHLVLRRQAKFGEDRTIWGWVIAYFRFSKWRPTTILDFVLRHTGPLTICYWWSYHPKIAHWSCLYFV